jgi:hypothetical protein
VLGDEPADWYLATQCLPGAVWHRPASAGLPAKGTLAHFESVFAGDASFARLRGAGVASRRSRPQAKSEKISA